LWEISWMVLLVLRHFTPKTCRELCVCCRLHDVLLSVIRSILAKLLLLVHIWYAPVGANGLGSFSSITKFQNLRQRLVYGRHLSPLSNLPVLHSLDSCSSLLLSAFLRMDELSAV